MELFDDATRLAMLKATGAEEFDTGNPALLWATLEGEYNDPELSGIPIEGEIRWIEVRSSDIDLHRLVKDSPLRQVSTGDKFLIKRFEPSKSTGFTIVRLSK